MKHLIIVGILSIHALFASGQEAFKNIKNERVKSTVTGMYNYMKGHDFDTSMVTRFFNIKEMQKRLSNQKMANIQLQYQIVSGIDRMIDVVPADSIFFMEVPDSSNKYVAGFIIDHERYPMLDIEMDGSGKFIYVMPFIYFEPEKQQQIRQFLGRYSTSIYK